MKHLFVFILLCVLNVSKAQFSIGTALIYNAEPDWNRGFNNSEMELYRFPILLNAAADPMLRAAFSGTFALTANYQISPKFAVFAQLRLLYRTLKVGDRQIYTANYSQLGLQILLGRKHTLISKEKRPLLELKTAFSADFQIQFEQSIGQGVNSRTFNSQGENVENQRWSLEYLNNFCPAAELGLQFNHFIDEKQSLSFGMDLHYQLAKTMRISAYRYYKQTDANGQILGENLFIYKGNPFKANYFSFSLAYNYAF